MKKLYSIITVILLTVSANAQAPEQMSYQAVIRDASNTLITNQAIGMRISIIQGSATGTAVYIETQSPITNTNGLVSLEIGTGTTSADFSTIDWAINIYFIKIETDPAGGSNYTITGTSQLMSVPYALYSKNSGDKVFSTTNNVTSNSNGDIANDDFVFGKAQLDDEGSRMFFDKSKAAFRVGSSAGMGLTWADSNVGNYSFASGRNTMANAEYATSMGSNTIASGYASTAMGSNTTAFGDYSTTMGSLTTTESYAQTSIGMNNTTVSGDATYFTETDRLFVIGNGKNSSNKSDAMIIFKSGNTTINGNLDVNEVNATDSGDADMKAYMYGLVRNTGTIDTASSDGFTIAKTGTGSYTINFNNSPGGFDKYIVVASLYGNNGIGFIKMERQSASITINTYNTAGTLADKYFSFIVYKK